MSRLFGKTVYLYSWTFFLTFVRPKDVIRLQHIFILYLENLTLRFDPPAYHRTIYKSKLDDYKNQIVEWCCEPYCFNG